MFSLPSFLQLQHAAQRELYSECYEKASGLPIPTSYLDDPHNRVFAFYRKGQMIGGFILGASNELRTIEVFARPEDHVRVNQLSGQAGERTEITCFWICKSVRKQVLVNRFIWCSMIYGLLRYSKKSIVFGTCSRGLARLYATSERAELIHQDRINNRQNFIFLAQKSGAFAGMLNILAYKSSWKLKGIRRALKPSVPRRKSV